jgi:DNA-binding transcriptional ArsR family regulator
MAIAQRGNSDLLGPVFLALADPTRRGIVEELRAGDATVGELAERLAVATPSVSKHLTVLERAGLVSRHREAQWRRCRLEGAAFARLREWVDHYESFWTGSLDRLEARLRDERQ